VLGLLVAIVAGTGWVMRDRLEAVSRPLIDRAVSLGATAERALPRKLDAAPVPTPAKRDSTTVPSSRPSVRAPRAPQGGAANDAGRDASVPDDRIAREAAGRLERAPSRDSVTLVRQTSADEALMLRKVPTVGDGAEMEALTNDVEHATKAKVESAQKPLIDLKPPVFKKP
jgi:hypothetical protein